MRKSARRYQSNSSVASLGMAPFGVQFDSSVHDHTEHLEYSRMDR